MMAAIMAQIKIMSTFNSMCAGRLRRIRNICVAVAFFVVSTLPFFGCSDVSHIVFSDFAPLGKEGLRESDIYMFPLSASDSIDYPDALSDVVIVVRYDNSTVVDTLPLRMFEFNGSTFDADTVDISISLKPESAVLAEGGYGIREVCDTVRHGVKLPDGYSVGLVSRSAGNVRGLRSIGVVVCRNDK